MDNPSVVEDIGDNPGAFEEGEEDIEVVFNFGKLLFKDDFNGNSVEGDFVSCEKGIGIAEVDEFKELVEISSSFSF